MKTLIKTNKPELRKGNGTPEGVKALAKSLIRGKALLAILLISGLTSCSKQANDLPTPAKPKSVTVMYAVTCSACAVYFEDNTFNRNNQTARNEQYQVIHGSWTTTFKADTAFKIASLRIYSSVFTPAQSVHARIVTSDNRDIDKTFDLSPDNNAASFELPLQ